MAYVRGPKGIIVSLAERIRGPTVIVNWQPL
jgi:hypothetical protein